MYSGWMRSFPTDRFLSAQESASRFDPRIAEDVAPDERASLVHFNSTYIDLIDRRFRLRGMVSTTMVLLGTLALFLFGFFLLFTLVIPNLEGDFWDWVMYAMVGVCVVGAPVLFWHTTLRATSSSPMSGIRHGSTGATGRSISSRVGKRALYPSHGMRPCSTSGRGPARPSCATCAAASLRIG